MTRDKHIRVLHLTPHMGGGVGEVMRSYLAQAQNFTPNITHSVVSLDTLNAEGQYLLDQHDIEYVENIGRNYTALDDLVAKADIVLIHWWNHPLLQEFIYNHQLPDCRIMIWAHVSGAHAPNNFTKELFEYSEHFYFTTPVSTLCPEVVGLAPERKSKLKTIWSTAGVERLDHLYNPHRLAQDKPHIGYVGNLDYSKIHPEFIDITSELAQRVSSRYSILGPARRQFSQDWRKVEAFIEGGPTGYVDEATKFELMSSFTIFSYPLSRWHYATCDQSIQEAMALGVPCVVLNNPMECHMVRHGETGLVAHNIEQYIDYAELLAKDKHLNAKLSKRARNFARQAYSIETLCHSWANEFKMVMSYSKTKAEPLSKHFGGPLLPHRLFLATLGPHSGLFEALLHQNEAQYPTEISAQAQLKSLMAHSNWTSPTKSSPRHFADFFPEDEILAKFATLIAPSMDHHDLIQSLKAL